MSIEYYWLDENRKDIMILIYSPIWTWSDFYETKLGVDEFLLSVNHDVYMINDHSNAPLLPIGKRSFFREVPDTFDSAPKNLAGVYTVGAPALVRIVLSSLKRITMNRLLKNLTFAKTLEDALRLIQIKQNDSASSV